MRTSNIVALACFASVAFGAGFKPPKNWIKTGFRDYFYLYLPPDIKEEEVHPVDSYFQIFKSASIKIDVSAASLQDPLYSPTADPFHTVMDRPEFQERSEIIDGRKARVITYYMNDNVSEFPYFYAIDIPDTGYGNFIIIYASCKDKKDYATVSRIFSSIHYK
jgi:hypothetical protein